MTVVPVAIEGPSRCGGGEQNDGEKRAHQRDRPAKPTGDHRRPPFLGSRKRPDSTAVPMPVQGAGLHSVPMRVLFLGTRGEIEARSRRHARHSAVLVGEVAGDVMVDCGADWLEELERLDPVAIVLTHAHPDHVAGLKRGAACPVYATDETWRAIDRYPLADRVVVHTETPFEIAGLRLAAFAVDHSLRAPAVGYRVEEGGASLAYVPDVARIADPRSALGGVDLYVGDGASVTRGILRRRGGVPIGHASIRTQLGWCAEAGVREALFTHGGSQIVRGDERALSGRVAELGRAVGVRAGLAFDGLELRLPGSL